VPGSAFGPRPAASERNWLTHGGSRRPATRPSSGLARPAPRPTVCARGARAGATGHGHHDRKRRGGTGGHGSCAAVSGARAQIRWRGCAGQEDRRRGSPNRRRVGGGGSGAARRSGGRRRWSEHGGVEIDGEMARSVAHRAGERRRRCGRNSGEGNRSPRVGRTDIDGVCRGVLRVGTGEGKRGRGAAVSSGSFLGGGG
jgi:hypothetical protein